MYDQVILLRSCMQKCAFLVNVCREVLPMSPLLGCFSPLTSISNLVQTELNWRISPERMNGGIYYGDDGQPWAQPDIPGSYWHLFFSSSPSFHERKLKAFI